MKYLRYFETEADSTKASDNGEFVKPHVSYTNETKRVDFIGKNSVSITMKSTADTTVDVFYTVDDFKALKGNKTITLKANEAKTTLINRPYIFSPGVVKYDYANGGGVSANTAVTEITIDGTVENGEYLFRACTSLTSLDVSNLDTSKMTNMYQMFNCCSGLTSLDVSNFDMSNVTLIGAMFIGCSNLTAIKLFNLDKNNLNLNYLFQGCAKLKSLNLSGFGGLKTRMLEHTFADCSSLTSLDLSNFDTSNVGNMDALFRSNLSLTSLNLGTFDMGEVTTSTDMFKGINPKVEITLAADSPSLTNIQTQLITDGVTGAKIHFNGKTYYYDTATKAWKGITSGNG